MQAKYHTKGSLKITRLSQEIINRLQRSRVAEVKHGEEETGIDAVAETVKPNGIVVAALPEKIGDRPKEVVPTGVRPATSCGSASG